MMVRVSHYSSAPIKENSSSEVQGMQEPGVESGGRPKENRWWSTLRRKDVIDI